MTTAAAEPASREPAEAFFLRSAAIWAAVTMPLARLIAPGLRGNARDAVVVAWQLAAAAASYALALLLGAVAVEAALSLLKIDVRARSTRTAVLMGTLVTMALVAPSFIRRLPPQPAIALVLAASVAVVIAASRALMVPRLRAAAFVMALFALAALMRLFGWQLAVAAGERVSDNLFAVSRAIATFGVVLEAGAQLTVVAWLGTRGRIAGQLLTSAAVAIGFLLTWNASVGVHHEASPWQSILHTALLDANVQPAPYGLSAVATFLLAASFPLAIAATLQRGPNARIACALALAIAAHGAYDAPLRALAAVAAAIALLSIAEDARA